MDFLFIPLALSWLHLGLVGKHLVVAVGVFMVLSIVVVANAVLLLWCQLCLLVGVGIVFLRCIWLCSFRVGNTLF